MKAAVSKLDPSSYSNLEGLALDLDELSWHTAQPIATPNAIPMY